MERTNVGFRRRKLELNDGNLGFFDSGGSASLSDDVLVQEDTIDELGIVDSSTNFFDESDISQVDVGRSVGDESENRVDCDGGDDGSVLRDDLASKAGLSIAMRRS